MAFAATLIMNLLAKYPWISWLGLFVLIYVAGEMLFRGVFQCDTGMLSILGYADLCKASLSATAAH